MVYANIYFVSPQDDARSRRDLSSGVLPSYPGSADLVKLLDLKSTPSGVEKAHGICDRRPDSDEPDAAYKITDRAVASIPTAQVFPGKYRVRKYTYIKLSMSKTFQMSRTIIKAQ